MSYSRKAEEIKGKCTISEESYDTKLWALVVGDIGELRCVSKKSYAVELRKKKQLRKAILRMRLIQMRIAASEKETPLRIEFGIPVREPTKYIRIYCQLYRDLNFSPSSFIVNRIKRTLHVISSTQIDRYRTALHKLTFCSGNVEKN